MTFITTYIEEISLLIAILSLVVTIIGTFRGRIDAELLGDRASWPEISAEFRSTTAETYFAAIEATLLFAKRVWGQRLLSWTAYRRCLQLAFAYPLIAVLLGWVVFDTAALGGAQVFDPGTPFATRGVAALGIVGLAGLAGVTFLWRQNALEILDVPLDLWNRQFDQRPGWGWSLLRWGGVVFLSALSVFAGALLLVLATLAATLAIGGPDAVTSSIGMLTVLFAAIVMALGTRIWQMLGVASAATLFLSFIGEPFVAGLLLLFILVLPPVNAAADMASLAITRGFLARLAARRPTLHAILLRLSLDLLLAALCLVLLLGGTLLLLELADSFPYVSKAFSWQLYVQEVAIEPARGVPLYLMVATTLLPTFVHAVAGVGAIIAQKSRRLGHAATVIDGWQAQVEMPSLNQRRKLAAQIRWAKAWGLFAASVLVCAGSLALWSLIGWGLGLTTP